VEEEILFHTGNLYKAEAFWVDTGDCSLCHDIYDDAPDNDQVQERLKIGVELVFFCPALRLIYSIYNFHVYLSTQPVRRAMIESMKQMIWLGGLIGSTAGGYVPALWGGSLFSFSSLVLGTVGGAAGIIIAFRMTQ